MLYHYPKSNNKNHGVVMQKLTKVALFISAVLPSSLLAQTIEGVVLGKNGKVIAGATVEIEGVGTMKTNELGQFSFSNLPTGKNELHITAPGFSHLNKHIVIGNESTQTLTFTLANSPIEVIDVVATPLHMSTMESATPVSVLAGESLRRQQSSTLGDSLEKVVGVNTNFHGNVASTPIIRGLSGPRVMIAQNGLDVSDVSRVGPDHSVASEASTAQQIEVLRGPATLFYGSGAIGGVVNVVDNRIPTDSASRGEWLIQNSSVDEGKLASFNATTGTDSFAFYLDGYWRESHNYKVPVEPQLETEEEHEAHEEEHHDSHDFVVENSGEESNGITLGGSYLFDAGYVGLSVEQFNRQYGVPGHSHEEESEVERDEHEHGEQPVYADLEQTRIQLLSEYNVKNQWIDKVTLRAGLTDYQHAEIEDGEVGTTFENETNEVKIDVIHGLFDDWQGGMSFHYKSSDVSAQGEEAFTPPSSSETVALAIIEEKHFDNVLVQLGARVEKTTLESEHLLTPELEVHGSEEHEEHDEHEEHEESSHEHAHYEFTPVTLSAGVVWDFTPGYNLGFSLSRSERAPSASELMSFGPHIGTGTYEVGALYEYHQDEMHFELAEHAVEMETANNIDITLRKTEGDVGFIFNLFYNKVENYYYQASTGLLAEVAHEEHGEGTEDSIEDEEAHSDDLPIYIFQYADSTLKGFEAQVAWQVSNGLKLSVFSDYVSAELNSGEALPRTPPLRIGSQLDYAGNQWTAHLDVTHYQKQDKVSVNETETDGYTLIDASVSYDLNMLNNDISIFLKGRNLTNTEARVHSSFLKELAPRPGRNLTIGVQGYF
jgi:iron complex outermembrane receptor protein